VHLFEKLKRRGANFVVYKEAISYEYIPAIRGTRKYLFNRSLRGGQSHVRRKLESNKKFLYEFLILSKLIIELFEGLFFIILYPFSNEISINGIVKLGDSIGKFRLLINNYKKVY
jgi:hypothetical protein